MPTQPVFIATWKFGVQACNAGWKHLANRGNALDAIEIGGNVTEDDPTVNSVGYGGLPNAEGVVELDAAIMDGLTHSAGSVGGLTKTSRAISVARRVMDKTPHVMLVGENAVRFARQQGFIETEQLTDAMRERWLQWQESQSGPDVSHFDNLPRTTSQTPNKLSDRPGSTLLVSNHPTHNAQRLTPDDHDTIGLCALDCDGNLAVGCTTSGMAWKLPGRVGDSPIIGSGLYVDNEIGAAAATGHGDEMIKACVSFRVVEMMERGMTPTEACIDTLRYLMRKRPPEQHDNYGAALIALRKDGEYGAASTLTGFRSPDRLWNWAVSTSPVATLHEGVYVTPTTIRRSL